MKILIQKIKGERNDTERTIINEAVLKFTDAVSVIEAVDLHNPSYSIKKH